LYRLSWTSLESGHGDACTRPQDERRKERAGRSALLTSKLAIRLLAVSFSSFLTRRGRIRRTNPRRRAGSIPRPSPETRVRPVSTARSLSVPWLRLSSLLTFRVHLPHQGGAGVRCDPRARAGTGTRARNETHQAHSRLLSRTDDPRPVHTRQSRRTARQPQ
jgi:hypothetical protein